MSLKYSGEWKFGDGIGFGVSLEARNALESLLINMADGSKPLIERFKVFFGGGGNSTSYDWALTDLSAAIDSRVENAALFVDSVWSCVQLVEQAELPAPTAKTINQILAKYNVPLKIDPPNLILLEPPGLVVDASDANINSTDDGL